MFTQKPDVYSETGCLLRNLFLTQKPQVYYCKSELTLTTSFKVNDDEKVPSRGVGHVVLVVDRVLLPAHHAP